MSAIQWILRIAVFSQVIIVLLFLLPSFDFDVDCHLPATCEGTSYAIPDVVWEPFTAVLNLNQYFPVRIVVALLFLDILIKVGMVIWGWGSWVWQQVKP